MISLSPTSLHPSPISLMISVDVKHHERRRPCLEAAGFEQRPFTTPGCCMFSLFCSPFEVVCN